MATLTITISDSDLSAIATEFGEQFPSIGGATTAAKLGVHLGSYLEGLLYNLKQAAAARAVDPTVSVSVS